MMPPRTAPSFWMKDGAIARLLRPFSALYLFIHRIKMALANPYRASIPVLCIGGITAGGSGKTPTLHAVLKILLSQGKYSAPFILLRGYGGALKGPTLVDPAIHSADDVGDEALLHAIHAPTIVSANRAAGARLAELAGADIVLMDDGLQNNTLAKTLSLLVIDTAQGLGNGFVLPAGPLREPLYDALPRVDAVVKIGDGAIHLPPESRIMTARVASQASPQEGQTYTAFAGIGHPEKFRATLIERGFMIQSFIPFPDHHRYRPSELEDLRIQADGTRLITTQKDFLRLPEEIRTDIEYLPVTLTFDDESAIAELLKDLP